MLLTIARILLALLIGVYALAGALWAIVVDVSAVGALWHLCLWVFVASLISPSSLAMAELRAMNSEDEEPQ
jgi:hypothetical protein